MLNKLKQYGISTFLKFAISELVAVCWKRPVLHSYSQCSEDLVLDKLLKSKKKGFYVDVGAYDPYRFSNTMRFYRRGWRGINIEPDRGRWERFTLVRPRDINLNVGVGRKRGKLTFYRMDPQTISTFSKKQADEYLKQGFRLVGSLDVPVRTLERIFAAYAKRIDFLTLDVEGFEMEVLASNDWKRFRPALLCIETPEEKEKHMIIRFLKRKGYAMVFDNGLNSFYEDKHL